MIQVLLKRTGSLGPGLHACALPRGGETSHGSARLNRSLFEREEYCGQKEYIAKGTEARNNSIFGEEYNLVWASLVAQ